MSLISTTDGVTLGTPVRARCAPFAQRISSTGLTANRVYDVVSNSGVAEQRLKRAFVGLAVASAKRESAAGWLKASSLPCRAYSSISLACRNNDGIHCGTYLAQKRWNRLCHVLMASSIPEARSTTTLLSTPLCAGSADLRLDALAGVNAEAKTWQEWHI